MELDIGATNTIRQTQPVPPLGTKLEIIFVDADHLPLQLQNNRKQF